MIVIINPGLIDRSDVDPPAVYRIMTPRLNSKQTTYASIKHLANGLEIPSVMPMVNAGVWTNSARILGVREIDVQPQNPPPGTLISPGATIGAGVSIVPIMADGIPPAHRVPLRNGGTGRDDDCWFSLKRDTTVGPTRLHFDAGDSANFIKHGVIEPSHDMLPDYFADLIRLTAPHWVCMNH